MLYLQGILCAVPVVVAVKATKEDRKATRMVINQTPTITGVSVYGALDPQGRRVDKER
jgi:hypothetical protein